MRYSELVDSHQVQDMMEAVHAATRIPMELMDLQGSLAAVGGRKDLCASLHCANVEACSQCVTTSHGMTNAPIDKSERLYGLGCVTLPIRIDGSSLATLCVGPFSYEDEKPAIETIRNLVSQSGRDEKACLAALARVPVISRQTMQVCLERHRNLAENLAGLGMKGLSLRQKHTGCGEFTRAIQDGSNPDEESAHNFHALFMFNDMAEGVALHRVIYDASGQPVNYVITDVNHQYERIIRKTQSEVVNRMATDVYRTPEAPFLKEYAKVAATGVPYYFEPYFAAWKKHYSVFVTSFKKGTFATIFTDITERKRQEKDRRHLEAKMLHLQKLESLGNLAGGIAHDFNNLLMTTLGNVDLALSDLPPTLPSVRENLTEIRQATMRAAELCKQMLAYSGRSRLVIRNLNLTDLVKEMAHMIERSASGKVTLRYACADGLPMVKADATQMRQIIMNLVVNASEAIGELDGTVNITTGVMHCDRSYLQEMYLDDDLREGAYAYLEVADTGCGMTPEVKARVFDPFFSTKFTGRGLGLAAVFGIVRGHKGAIRVQSELGRGSAFRILLPVAESDAGVSLENCPCSATWRGSGTILLADDEESVRTVVRRMLERLGYSVVCATHGQEAVRLYQERLDQPDTAQRIHAVLLDLTMPHMDGGEAFRELQKMDPNVKVIMASGYSQQDVTQRFTGKGLAGFIQKPYTFNALIEAVRKLSQPA